ncbi:MAG: transporter associated domain-containing protein, partial [Acidimicrobiales bacterium]
EVNALLDGELPEDGDWDSVGGLVYHLLGHVPAEGESVEVEGYRLSAEKVQGRRIGRVRVTPRAESVGPADDEGGGGIGIDWVPTR